jgi:hypothetical protein
VQQVVAAALFSPPTFYPSKSSRSAPLFASIEETDSASFIKCAMLFGPGEPDQNQPSNDKKR